MADPRQAALDEGLRQLGIAAGSLTMPNWEQHDQAIVAALDGLSRFYLHTDAATGLYDPAPIYLDRSRVVYGLIPSLVEPLIRFLVRESDRFDTWVKESDELPALEVVDWGRWMQRLRYYEKVTEEELAKGADQPSERLWTHVTAPLLQGLYPADKRAEFLAWGIQDPSVPSKPDVTTLPTEVFVTALHRELVDDVQEWLLAWSDAVKDFFQAVELALTRFVTKVGDAARSVGWSIAKAVLIGAAVLGGGYVVYRLVNEGQSDG